MMDDTKIKIYENVIEEKNLVYWGEGSEDERFKCVQVKEISSGRWTRTDRLVFYDKESDVYFALLYESGLTEYQEDENSILNDTHLDSEGREYYIFDVCVPVTKNIIDYEPAAGVVE